MTLPADIGAIEAVAIRIRRDLSPRMTEVHAELDALLHAYRELAQERNEWRRLQHKAGRALESKIKECDRLRGDFQFQQNKADRVVTLNLALEVERDRLRAALKSIAEYDCPGGMHPRHCLGCASCDARAALADAQHPEQQPEEKRS